MASIDGRSRSRSKSESGSESESSTDTKSLKKKKQSTNLKDAIKTADDRSRYACVKRFFRDPNKCSIENIQLMVDIINKNHDISLRTINWFGTKHIATMDSRYIVRDGVRELFDPKIKYDTRLGRYGKRGFDPFRRGLAFEWNYDPSDKTKTVTTTLCQLQFFKWLFEYDLMDYIISNLSLLKETMRNSEKKKKQKKIAKAKQKVNVKNDANINTENIDNINNTDKNSNDTNSNDRHSTIGRSVKLKAKRSEKKEAKLVLKIG